MKTPKYFILNQQDGDFRHIGTIIVNNDNDLNAKIKEAIEDHFDCEAKKIPILTMDEVVYSHSGSYEFKVVIHDADEEDPNETIPYIIEIIETWLY